MDILSHIDDLKMHLSSVEEQIKDLKGIKRSLEEENKTLSTKVAQLQQQLSLTQEHNMRVNEIRTALMKENDTLSTKVDQLHQQLGTALEQNKRMIELRTIGEKESESLRIKVRALEEQARKNQYYDKEELTNANHSIGRLLDDYREKNAVLTRENADLRAKVKVLEMKNLILQDYDAVAQENKDLKDKIKVMEMSSGGRMQYWIGTQKELKKLQEDYEKLQSDHEQTQSSLNNLRKACDDLIEEQTLRIKSQYDVNDCTGSLKPSMKYKKKDHPYQGRVLESLPGAPIYPEMKDLVNACLYFGDYLGKSAMNTMKVLPYILKLFN